jgi:hypothetical protein
MVILRLAFQKAHVKRVGAAQAEVQAAHASGENETDCFGSLV